MGSYRASIIVQIFAVLERESTSEVGLIVNIHGNNQFLSQRLRQPVLCITVIFQADKIKSPFRQIETSEIRTRFSWSETNVLTTQPIKSHGFT